jgi:hypothetical protein
MSKRISELKDRTDIGTIIAFGGHVDPDGYLPCDGSSYNIVDKLPLFSTIGVNYGGSVTATPEDLDFLTTTEIKVVSIGTDSFESQIIRDRGLLGLPTNSSGIQIQIGGSWWDITYIAADGSELNTGRFVVSIPNIASEPFYSDLVTAQGTQSKIYSGDFRFRNNGSVTPNTGWSGTFNVPSLNSDSVVSANSSSVISGNVANRNEIVGSNTHELAGLTVEVSGNATMNVNGNISVAQMNAAKPNASITLRNTTITNSMIGQHKHHLLASSYQRTALRFTDGANLNRNLNHVRVRRSSNQSNDERHDLTAVGSNTNNFHNHTVTATTSGNISVGASSTTTTGNFNANFGITSPPLTIDVQNRVFTVKYLIKEI